VTRLLKPSLTAIGLLLSMTSSAQAPPPTQAPQPTPPPFVLEVDVNVVSVTAVVFDKAGRFVKGLGPKDIELAEDGVKQEVTYFREASGEGERIPLSVVLVLDTSGSMVPHMRFLQEAASNFLYKLEEGDSTMVVSFNESVKGSGEFTDDVERLEQAINGFQAWGGTSLYDSVHYALGRVKDQPGRKAVVVFSDGADTTSSMNDQAVVDYAKAVEATIYVIGFRGSPALFGSSPKGFYRKLCDETGGAFFFPDKVGELTKIFTEISSELKNHYLLSYSPARPPDGSYRAITLKLRAPEAAKTYEVRVRKGYFAVKRTRPPAKRP
jgi:Ca-activated chloride channel family protein